MSLATKCETTGWVTARDLAFIQNEHQHMLRGLHNEIESLQQRCAGEIGI